MAKTQTAKTAATRPTTQAGGVQKAAQVDPNGKEVVYPNLGEQRHVGANALTVDDVKRMLGWEEVDPKPVKARIVKAEMSPEDIQLAEQDFSKKMGEWEDAQKGRPEPLFEDRHGTKVRCTRNVTNRPFYMEDCNRYVQEILNRRWRYNGEPIILGRHGNVLNGQHNMVALVLAEQDREIQHKVGLAEGRPGKWDKNWPGPCTLEKLVVTGIDESDEVVNTMDTCKPRSLGDVIYRSPFFANKGANTRRAASRVLGYAVRMLWSRTGAVKDPFAPKMSHSEALAFIAAHPTLMECVDYAMALNRKGGLGEVSKKPVPADNDALATFLTPGYSAALMYLMMFSASDGGAYHAARNEGHPSETMLDPATKDLAKEFWRNLVTEDETLVGVKLVQRPEQATETEGLIFSGSSVPGTGKVNERVAYICQAWNLYARGEEVSPETLILDWRKKTVRGEEVWVLNEVPEVGGIDMGNRATAKPPKTTEQVDAAEAGDEGEEQFGGEEDDGRDIQTEDDEEVLEARKNALRPHPIDDDDREAELAQRKAVDEAAEASIIHGKKGQRTAQDHKANLKRRGGTQA